MTAWVRHTHSDLETEAVGAELARRLKPPLVVLLHGELGAGKTTFVRGFVGALAGGQSVTVQSPTFALARTYATTPPVHHLDLYRLEGAAGLEELGLLELLRDERAFSLVEWPRDLALSQPTASVRLTTDSSSADARRVEIEVPGAGDA